MGEHKRPPRHPQVAEDFAKEIALEIILGRYTLHTVHAVERLGEDVAYSVTFEQVWHPIKTALMSLLAADRGVISDIEVVGESVPIARPS